MIQYSLLELSLEARERKRKTKPFAPLGWRKAVSGRELCSSGPYCFYLRLPHVSPPGLRCPSFCHLNEGQKYANFTTAKMHPRWHPRRALRLRAQPFNRVAMAWHGLGEQMGFIVICMPDSLSSLGKSLNLSHLLFPFAKWVFNIHMPCRGFVRIN